LARNKKIQASTPAAPVAPRLLTVKQAAQYLNCAVWAIREMHWGGKVRGVTVGRRLLFDRAALDKYVDALVARA
jgi:excisionase family DNA binding protein